MPQTVDKSFKVKHGLTVIEGGSFGGPVIVGNPTLVNHAVTKAYVDALSFGGGGGGGSITVADEAPTVAIQGSGWYNSTTGKLYIYFDQFWVEVSYAEAGPQGQMGIPGPEGPKGDQGETGVGLPNVLTIGDVTAGYLPNATITGTSPNQVLNLVLPRGEQGVRGEQGLPGEPGAPGLPGQVGPEGPAGPRGLQGIPGTPGVSGAITVTAPIVNSGSINEAILSLDSSVTRNSIAQTLTNKTIDSPIFTGQSLEDIVISSTPFATEYIYSVKSGGIHYITAAASANGIVSFRGDASTTLNSFMPIGKSITCVLIISNGNTSFGVSGVKIDGASITPKWQSGTLPVGSTNATDAYTFTIIKTSTDTFTVFASQTKFA